MKVKQDGQHKIRHIKRIDMDFGKDEVPVIWSKSQDISLEEPATGRKLLENYCREIESLTLWCDQNRCLIGHIKLFLETKSSNAWLSTTGIGCRVESSGEFEDQHIQYYRENVTAILFGKDQSEIDHKLICLFKNGGTSMSILNEISEQLQIGKAKVVKELVQSAINQGIEPQKILDEGLLSGMAIIGEKFKNNEVFVPEVMVAARAMNTGATLLKPYMVSDASNIKGTVVIGTVKGDLHDIGKNLVKMMIECKGINVVDLGVDVAPETYLNAALENDADIIACSALLTTTMNEMASIVQLLKERGLKDKFKVMVGGSPVNQAFCEKIGADVYSKDAVSAAEKVIELLS